MNEPAAQSQTLGLYSASARNTENEKEGQRVTRKNDVRMENASVYAL
jgi:hypothetical protein